MGKPALKEDVNDLEGTSTSKDFYESFNDESATREVLEKEYQVDTTDIKNPEGLTYVILDLCVTQFYDKAIRELRGYFEYKSSFPTYRQETERVFQHIESIIRAIKTKKDLMLIPNITASKRKELHSTVVYHFQD